MSHRLLHRLLGVVSFMFAIACDPAASGPDGGESTVATEEADITVIAQEPTPPRRLATRPSASFATVPTDPPTELFEVAHVARLSEGRLVVADGGQRIFILDAAGSGVMRVIGGRGNGPGEFQEVGWVQVLPADSLLVYDRRKQRVSLFDRTGNFVRSATISGTAVQGRFEDGTYASAWNVAVPRSATREAMMVMRHAADGSVLATLDTVSGMPVLRSRDGGAIVMFDMLDLRYRPSPIPRFWMAVGRRTLYVGAGDSEGITAYPMEEGAPRTMRGITRRFPSHRNRSIGRVGGMTRCGRSHWRTCRRTRACR